MAKTNNKKKGKKGGGARTMVVRQVMREKRLALDALGAAYARLLVDPCNAPLVHSAYGGAEGTYLVKAETINDWGINPDATNGIFQWVPGVFSADGVIYGFNGANVAGLGAGPFIPGNAYITGNASQCRCIAACLEITYPGAELNRAGRVHYGHGNGGVLDIGVAIATNAITPMLEMMERTPAGKIEILWKPGQADGLFRDPNTAASIQDRERRASITVAWAGLPLVGAVGSAGVGLTFKQTAVYEYQPIRNIGVSIPNMARTTTNSLGDVMRALQARGERFLSSTVAQMVSNVAFAATSSAMGNINSRSQRLTFRNEL